MKFTKHSWGHRQQGEPSSTVTLTPGNPLGCAAAIASIERFERLNLLDNAETLATTIAEKLKPLTEHANVGEIRQKGTMVGIELVRDKATMDPFPSELRLGHQVTLAGRRRGIIIRPLGDVVVLMPAPGMPVETAITLTEQTVDSVEEVLGDETVLDELR